MAYRVVTLLILCTLFATEAAVAQLAPTPSRHWPIPPGAWVNRAEVVGRTAFVFGDFRRIGGESSEGQPLALDPVTGARSSCFTTNGSIELSTPDGGGGYYLTGSFTLVTDAAGTHPRPGLFRLSPDCRVDATFVPPANLPGVPGTSYAVRSIRALAVGEGRLFVGGPLSVSTPPAYSPAAIVALNATTGARDPAIADISLPSEISVPTSMVVAGATLRLHTSAAGGSFVIDFSLLNRSSSVVLRHSTFPYRLWRLGDLVVMTRTGLEWRLEAFDATSLHPVWTSPPFTTAVNSVDILDIVRDGNALYVGGTFQHVGGVPRAGVVRLHAGSGGVDEAWLPPGILKSQVYNTPGDVTRLAIRGSELLVTGRFQVVGGQPRTGLISLGVASGTLAGWAPPVVLTDRQVPVGGRDRWLLMPLGDTVVVGPGHYGGPLRDRAAAVDLDTGAVRAWEARLPGTRDVSAAASSGAQLWLSAPPFGLLRVPQADGTHTPQPATNPPAGSPASLATSGDVLYAGYGSPPRVAALNAADGSERPWAPPAFLQTRSSAGSISRLYATASTLFVGGWFNVVGGQPRVGFAALDAETGALLPMDLQLPDADGVSVGSFAADQDVLLVSSSAQYGGWALRAVSLTGPTVLPYSWPYGSHYPMAFMNGRLYGAGEYELVLASGVVLPASPCLGNFGVQKAGGAVLNLRPLQLCRQLVPVAPGAPRDLTVHTSGNQVNLGWAPPDDADTSVGIAASYVVRAGSTSGVADLADIDTGSLQTSLTATAPDGTYFVRVHSRNQFGLSPASNEVSFTLGAPPCGGLPSAPGSLGASVSALSVTFTWAAASGASSYVIEAGSAAGLSNLASVNVGAGLTFSTTAPPGTYFVRVRGSNACGLGPVSNEVPVTLGSAVAPPGVPLSFAYTLGPGHTVSLTWVAPTSGGVPTGYVVEAGSAPGLSNVAVAAVSGVSLVVPGVPAGTYYVRVRGVNATGQGLATVDLVVTVP